MSATDVAPQLTGYALDSSWYAERDRLNSLTALYDEATIAFCERLGVGDGWRCVELGAGTGSVAQLLVDRVAPSGHVLAVDVDTRFLDPLRSPLLHVEQVDVTTASLAPGTFDLIHARLLLEHLPQRDAVVHRLVRALAPGGWLLLEDFDWPTAAIVDPPAPVLARVAHACRTALESHGYDAEYGRRLPRVLRSAGLMTATACSSRRSWSAAPAANRQRRPTRPTLLSSLLVRRRNRIAANNVSAPLPNGVTE